MVQKMNDSANCSRNATSDILLYAAALTTTTTSATSGTAKNQISIIDVSVPRN